MMLPLFRSALLHLLKDVCLAGFTGHFVFGTHLLFVNVETLIRHVLLALVTLIAFILPDPPTDNYRLLFECLVCHILCRRAMHSLWPGDNIYEFMLSSDASLLDKFLLCLASVPLLAVGRRIVVEMAKQILHGYISVCIEGFRPSIAALFSVPRLLSGLLLRRASILVIALVPRTFRSLVSDFLVLSKGMAFRVMIGCFEVLPNIFAFMASSAPVVLISKFVVNASITISQFIMSGSQAIKILTLGIAHRLPYFLFFMGGFWFWFYRYILKDKITNPRRNTDSSLATSPINHNTASVSRSHRLSHLESTTKQLEARYRERSAWLDELQTGFGDGLKTVDAVAGTKTHFVNEIVYALEIARSNMRVATTTLEEVQDIRFADWNRCKQAMRAKPHGPAVYNKLFEGDIDLVSFLDLDSSPKMESTTHLLLSSPQNQKGLDAELTEMSLVEENPSSQESNPMEVVSLSVMQNAFQTTRSRKVEFKGRPEHTTTPGMLMRRELMKMGSEIIVL